MKSAEEKRLKHCARMRKYRKEYGDKVRQQAEKLRQREKDLFILNSF